jgi:adenylate cyclase
MNRNRIRQAIRGFGERQLRISCGLVMFAYLVSHFTNHALGNISYAAMKEGLKFHMAVWRFPPVMILLYSAAVVHGSLGLWALYKRRQFHWKLPEVIQLALGLAIPALMLQHLVGLRLPVVMDDKQRYYAHALGYYWLFRNDLFLYTFTGLFVAWTHACIGLFFWLRMRPIFTRVGPVLLAFAVLLPALAALGVYQGGRDYIERQKDAKWRQQEFTQPTTPPERVLNDEIKSGVTMAWLTLVLLVFAARAVRDYRERTYGTVRISYPDQRRALVPRGYSVLEASLRFRIPHASVCGGRARCSTCRVRVLGDCAMLPPPSRREMVVLNRVGAGGNPAVRLACQLRPRSDITVVPLLPVGTDAAWLRSVRAFKGGKEQYIVAMFIDMRESSRLAETRLPFDAVFILNRFLTTVSEAVERAGGAPNQFVGDGLLALFGLTTPRDAACRQALHAAASIGIAVERLNALLEEDLPQPIRFGIGIHAGKVVVGDIGYKGHYVFTALGTAINVAARLQELTKDFNCEVVLSDEICRAGDLATAPQAQAAVEVRGRSAPLDVCAIARARDIVNEIGATVSAAS